MNRKPVWPIFGLFCLILLTGCGNIVYNQNESSMEEGLFITSQTEAFESTVFYINVQTATLDNSGLPFPVAYHPSFSDTLEIPFSHLVLTKKSDGGLWLVFLNDERPPQVTGEFQIKLDENFSYLEHVNGKAGTMVDDNQDISE
jgi:hypothetical protein